MNLKQTKQIPRFQSARTPGRIGKALPDKAFGIPRQNRRKYKNRNAPPNARTSSVHARCGSR